MELGGMDPLLVMKDANVIIYLINYQYIKLEKAVDVTIRSRLANSGKINK